MYMNISFNLRNMYPFFSFLIAVILAQLLKPFFFYLKTGKFIPKLIFAAGSFPSSHSAGVVSLMLATGLQERFRSTLFAAVFAYGMIVIYDAANVRYFAGKNIEITKQIIKDLKKSNIKLEHDLYDYPIKEILGHKWSEVLGGIIIGILVAVIYFYSK